MKKFGPVSLGVAILSTVLLIGSCIFTVQKLVSNAAVVDWQQGASVLSKSPTDWNSESFRQSIRDLHATGANSVSLIIPYWQSSRTSSDIAPALNAPTDETLIAAVNYIHSLGMQVMFKPHLEANGVAWRATIDPTDRNTWYANYSAMLNHLGDIGKQTNTEVICIGTEMIYTATYTSNADNTQRWIGMINSLRTHYNGKLTYSANWGGPGVTDEKNHIGFWANLDYIGYSAYFNLYSNTTDYNALKSAWDTYRKNDVEPLYNQYKKPIIFTEVGYRSVTGAHNQPWDYALNGAYDPTEQANDYDALFKFWDQYSYIAGVQLWFWDSNPNAGGQGDTNYTPQNKPAETIMSKWFGTGVIIPPGTTTPPTNPGTSTPPTNPGTTTPPTTPGTWSASGIAVQGTAGQPHSFNVIVGNTGTVNDAVVDVEVYNQSNGQAAQKYFEHQNFAGKTNTYSVNWTPASAGNYTVKVGVFTNNWQTNYYWNNNVFTVSVAPAGGTTTPPTNPGTTTPPTNPGTTTPPTGKITPTVQTQAASSVTQTTATLNGTVNMNGGNGTVWFEYGTNPNAATYSEAWPNTAGVQWVNGSNAKTIAVPIQNLKPNTTYYFRIKAENYTGGTTGVQGNVVSFTTGSTTTPPPTQGPINPTVATHGAQVSGTSATITGTVNINGGSGHVWFEYGTNPRAASYYESWPYQAGVQGVSGTGVKTLTVQLKNLQPRTTYYYRINAENYTGGFTKSVGEIKSFTTQ